MSSIFKAISRQVSNVDVTRQKSNQKPTELSRQSSNTSLSRQKNFEAANAVVREAITMQFTKGRIDTSGSYGYLSPNEENLLADFWEQVLDDLDKPLESIPSDILAKPVDCDDGVELKKAVEIQESSPFQVFEECMFNQTVADKCKEMDIVSQHNEGGKIVPEYKPMIKDKTLRSALWSVVREDHPDVLILRFLRARKWDIDRAYKMAIAAIKWRIEEDVEGVIWHGDLLNDASLMWKGVSYSHGKDRLGQPIIWSSSCLHHQKDQSYPQLKRYLIWMMETLRQLLAPPIERVCLIMDLTDHSNSNMDWPFVKTFLKFLESYYPECLGICIVYNGPWWFSGVWKLISPLLDPVVAAKVQFAQKPEGLMKFISEDQLLAARGGKNNYTYQYIKPDPEENRLMFDKETREKLSAALEDLHGQFVQATADWTGAKEAGDDDKFAAASRKRMELSHKIREAAVELDKYTRARHFYTRAGILQPGGAVDWSKIQSAPKEEEAET